LDLDCYMTEIRVGGKNEFVLVHGDRLVCDNRTDPAIEHSCSLNALSTFLLAVSDCGCLGDPSCVKFSIDIEYLTLNVWRSELESS
jgi:hypothetical protein